ncbi:hypothetical protein F2Q68_00043562 [Brassica cretica]|uniref:Secreted protein n=1 Tax=Brassica cretica TaxID=69181 RepID=A0A8S9LUJ7_BRACR|nr:hypothetical protein F2Q68_00043562 [Brassica cretica]
MLLPPLCLLGLSLVSSGNFTDLDCRLRLLHCERNPRSEEVRGYALTTTTKTERRKGCVTDAGDAGLRNWKDRERDIF